MTLSITTLDVMAFSIITLGVMALNITTLGIMTLIITYQHYESRFSKIVLFTLTHSVVSIVTHLFEL
jgi:hypothetical protein